MDKRILFALIAAGAYVLLRSGGKLGDINALLKEHGIVAAIIGGMVYFLADGKPVFSKPAYDEFSDLPPDKRESLEGYTKQPHSPIAGFDARYKPLGV